MRRYVQEGHDGIPTQILSMEEEAIEIAEATEIGNEIVADNAGQERAADTVQGLENLEDVVSNIEEATPGETALADQVVDMATAGTEISADEVAPSMEAYVGRRIAVESIRESAKRIWDAFLEVLKKIWKNIEGFFYKVFGVIPTIRRRLEGLEEKIDSTRSKSIKNKKFNVSTSYLAVDYKPVKKAGELLSAVKDLSKTAELVYKDGVEAFAKAGSSVAEAISDFSVEKKDESVAKVVTALNGLGGRLKVHGSSGTSNRDDMTLKHGAQLLGNKRITSYVYKSKAGEGKLETLDGVRKNRLAWESSRDKEGPAVGSFEFETMTMADAGNLVKELMGLLDILEDYKRGSAWKDVAKARAELERASGKAAAELDKVKGSSEADEKAAVPYYRSLVRLNQSFAGWVSEPATQLMSHSIKVINAATVVVNKSIAQYE